MDSFGDQMLNLILQVHKSATLHHPICHNVVILPKSVLHDLSFESICLEDLTLQAYHHFEKKDFRKGSVHVDPIFWTGVFLEALKTRKKELPSEDSVIEIQIPNGCCNVDECPIKAFYEILVLCVKENARRTISPQR